jgi:hypothetical protein
MQVLTSDRTLLRVRQHDPRAGTISSCSIRCHLRVALRGWLRARSTPECHTRVDDTANPAEARTVVFWNRTKPR